MSSDVKVVPIFSKKIFDNEVSSGILAIYKQKISPHNAKRYVTIINVVRNNTKNLVFDSSCNLAVKRLPYFEKLEKQFSKIYLSPKNTVKLIVKNFEKI